jgi:hypothetical protein
MHPGIKNRPIGEKALINTVKPLLLHDVTNPATPANVASRRRLVARQSTPDLPNHLRHHVSRNSQAS